MREKQASRLLVEADHVQRAFVARRLSMLGLHIGQEQVLMRLWEKDGVSQSELLAKLGCAAPTLTKAVQRLERVGLVRRERGGRPRVSRVYLTQAGWELRHPVEGLWDETERRLAAGMDAEQYAAFVTALRQVIEAFQEPTDQPNR